MIKKNIAPMNNNKLKKIHFKKWKISEKAPNNALDLNIIKNKFIINSILL